MNTEKFEFMIHKNMINYIEHIFKKTQENKFYPVFFHQGIEIFIVIQYLLFLSKEENLKKIIKIKK